MIVLRLLSIGAVVWLAGNPAIGDPLNEWQIRNRPGFLPWAIGYGEKGFVGVIGGQALISTNGQDWITRTVPYSDSVYSIAYGNGTYVAAFGTGFLVTHDLLNWSRVTFTLAGWAGHVAFGDGRFVAVGSDPSGSKAIVQTSADGLQWNGETLSTNRPLRAVRYLGGRFIALGERWLATSSDGLSWAYSSYTDGPLNFFDVASIGEAFVIVGHRTDNDHGGFMYSTNGIDWEFLADRFTAFPVTRIIGAAGAFVATGDNFSTPWNPEFYTSTDGRNWVGRTYSPATSCDFIEVAYGLGAFVLLGTANDGVSVGSSVFQSAVIPAASANPTTLSIGQFAGVEITGQPGRVYRIERTSEAGETPTWEPAEVMMLPHSPYLWFDRNSRGLPNQTYYRAVLLQ